MIDKARFHNKTHQHWIYTIGGLGSYCHLSQQKVYHLPVGRIFLHGMNCLQYVQRWRSKLIRWNFRRENEPIVQWRWTQACVLFEKSTYLCIQCSCCFLWCPDWMCMLSIVELGRYHVRVSFIITCMLSLYQWFISNMTHLLPLDRSCYPQYPRSLDNFQLQHKRICPHQLFYFDKHILQYKILIQLTQLHCNMHFLECMLQI